MSMPNEVAGIMKIIGNNDPEQMFYEACKRYNVNPEDILSEIR